MKNRPRASIPPVRKESLHGVIDRCEGDYAVLVFDDGQRLLWPRKQLPVGAKEGVAVTIALAVDPTGTEQRSAKLRNLLADISGDKLSAVW